MAMMGMIWQALFLAVLLALLAYYLLNVNFEGYLEKLTRDLHGTYRRERSVWRQILSRRSYLFEGRHHGRQVNIRYSYFPILSKRFHADELEIVILLVQKFWLRLLPRLIDSETKDEVTTGFQELDLPYRIHSNQLEAARIFLTNGYVSDQFRMLRYLFQKMEIHRGRLAVHYARPVGTGFQQSDLEAALGAIVNLIAFYEAQSMPFRILAAAVSEVCPYCREELKTQIERIVQCRHCGTHVHEACWLENAHCTTWGCRSTEALQVL